LSVASELMTWAAVLSKLGPSPDGLWWPPPGVGWPLLVAGAGGSVAGSQYLGFVPVAWEPKPPEVNNDVNPVAVTLLSNVVPSLSYSLPVIEMLVVQSTSRRYQWLAESVANLVLLVANMVGFGAGPEPDRLCSSITRRLLLVLVLAFTT